MKRHFLAEQYERITGKKLPIPKSRLSERRLSGRNILNEMISDEQHDKLISLGFEYTGDEGQESYELIDPNYYSVSAGQTIPLQSLVASSLPRLKSLASKIEDGEDVESMQDFDMAFERAVKSGLNRLGINPSNLELFPEPLRDGGTEMILTIHFSDKFEQLKESPFRDFGGDLGTPVSEKELSDEDLMRMGEVDDASELKDNSSFYIVNNTTGDVTKATGRQIKDYFLIGEEWQEEYNYEVEDGFFTGSIDDFVISKINDLFINGDRELEFYHVNSQKQSPAMNRYW